MVDLKASNTSLGSDLKVRGTEVCLKVNTTGGPRILTDTTGHKLIPQVTTGDTQVLANATNSLLLLTPVNLMKFQIMDILTTVSRKYPNQYHQGHGQKQERQHVLLNRLLVVHPPTKNNPHTLTLKKT